MSTALLSGLTWRFMAARDPCGCPQLHKNLLRTGTRFGVCYLIQYMYELDNYCEDMCYWLPTR
ncbi:Hypothetical predicted protein, partial [Paramuricea clavata]